MDAFERELWTRLGAACREARIARGLGVNQLAKILKMHAPTLSRFENGKRIPNSVEKLVAYLRIRIHFDFMTEKQE
jgi:transcriptional regulator with XRE-family HTH domain